jgi:hypothetical protein
VISSVSLAGVVDLHIHSAPDVRPRKLDDLAVARQAEEAGMKAVLIKSHYFSTAERAFIASSQVQSARVFGALVLNQCVGGLNPAAVEAALALGAKEIWMPTISAAHWNSSHSGRASFAAGRGILVVNEAGELLPEVHEILALVAKADVILGTGHLSISETLKLVPAARAAGVQRVLVTHPELVHLEFPIALQQELCNHGAFFERCYLNILPGHACQAVAALAHQIRVVGVETTVLSTDLGQPESPLPVEGFRQYIAALMKEGFTQLEIDRMARQNPGWLVGL